MKKNMKTRRCIRFRGLSIKDNRWVYGNLNIEYDNTCFICFWVSVLVEPDNNYYEMKHISVEVRPETVGQFTGHINNDGVEIYEDDVISSYNELYQVIFTHSDGLKLGCIYPKDSEIYMPTHVDYSYNKIYGCRVLGNIHENNF